MNLLEVRNLKVHFPVTHGVFSRSQDVVRAVDDVSLAIAPGETVGLVGESGCGKTTLGRAVVRLIEPTSGKVLFDGEDIAGLTGSTLRARRRNFQMIFQDPYGSLDPRMTVTRIIGEALDIHRLAPEPAARRRRIEALLAEVGMDSSHAQRYPHELSGGQRQRIGIARVLALEPRLMVCDEPVSALDVSVRAQVLNLISDLVDELNLTLIFVSHDLSVVKHVCDRVAVMNQGQIVETGTTGEVYAAPSHPYTRRLVSAIPTLHRALAGATAADLTKGDPT